MPDTIIEIDGLGKRYALSHRQRPDSLKAWLRNLAQHSAGRADGADEEEFWALSDVSFHVHEGECLALTGRNGSGKSTLLKILSRVIPPSTGRVRLRGRVASLLEIGTGFHPDLTGRENVFLNGAMLSCPEPELRRQFDAIVDFSGVERFLDTPVKHYSSGMYVRLAYAIAAHVHADILVIDEVLAVGDAEFQRKCLDHLAAQKIRGCSVIFVSHTPETVERLATRQIQLDGGRIVGAV